MTVSTAKTAKLIEMPFEGRLLWIQGTMYSVGVHIGTMWHMWWIDRAVVVVSPVTSITVATCLFTYRFYSHCSCFFYYSVVHRFISRFLSVIHVLFFFCRLHLFYYAFTHHTIGPEALCFFGCLSVFMRKYVCASLQMGPPDALCFWVVSPSVHAQAEAFSDRFVVGF